VRIFVLDASVALRWFLEDPVPEYAARVRRMLLDGDRALVPIVWNLEIANALANSARKGVAPPEDLDDHLLKIEELLVHHVEVQSEGISVRRAFTTARTFGLTAYDASYLDLAQSEKLPLSTLDAQLRKAAERAGVEIVR
jgi:predicted nucleic acid-binding protein